MRRPCSPGLLGPLALLALVLHVDASIRLPSARGGLARLPRVLLKDKDVSARECVWRIVKHDVKELHSTLRGESVRFVGTLHQIAVDETRRIWRQVETFQQNALDETVWLRSETARLRDETDGSVSTPPRARASGEPSVRSQARVPTTVSATPGGLDSADEGSSGTLARVSVAMLAQQASLMALIDSYVHWRWPLLSWWVLTETTVKFPPFAPLLGWLLASADVESGVATAAVAGLMAGKAPADVEPPLALNLHEALLHMRPQIVAKIRHTVFHDPLSACTFAAVAARLLLILPLFQVAKLFGEGTRPFRQTLQRLALREAMRASERCNRVELRTSLPPPTRPRHGPHALEAPHWSARSLRWTLSSDGR